MARYTGAVCKLCRREGKKLFLKGERCTSSKCSLERRSYAPGQHGQGRKKLTEYGLQLRAKQTARRYYGLSESQFRKYFVMAVRHEGVTGDNLLRAKAVLTILFTHLVGLLHVQKQDSLLHTATSL